MAKLMVIIDVPHMSYGELRDVIKPENREIERENNGWFSHEDGDKILVDGVLLEPSKEDDSLFAFELIGIMP